MIARQLRILHGLAATAFLSIRLRGRWRTDIMKNLFTGGAASAITWIFSNISCLNAPLLPLLSEAGRIEGRNRQHRRIPGGPGGAT
jgi:hypothetical protein